MSLHNSRFHTFSNFCTLWCNLQGHFQSSQEGPLGLGRLARNALIFHSRRESQYLFLSAEPKGKAKLRDSLKGLQRNRGQGKGQSDCFCRGQMTHPEWPAQGWTSRLVEWQGAQRGPFYPLTSPDIIPSCLRLQILSWPFHPHKVNPHFLNSPGHLWYPPPPSLFTDFKGLQHQVARDKASLDH